MCVVIIQGKKRDIMCETGIDWEKLSKEDLEDNEINEGDEAEFFEANFGKDKIFPGGPTCSRNGIDIPAYITFNEHGGMDGSILTEIFRRLDHLEVFQEDRGDGLTPFVLLDGHQSRFDLEFLEYINNPSHKWNVCLGVPYGTSLWQVADSSEQNGLFKMMLNEKKSEIFQHRLSTFTQKLHLIRTDIIPLVNYAWPPAFTNKVNNLKAIKERGWYQFNRNLLLHYIIRASMTEDMIVWEKNCGLFGDKLLQELHSVKYVEDKGEVKLECTKRDENNLNFQGGATSQYVACNIMSEVDRQEAREHNFKRKIEGTTAVERLNKITKRITSGKLTLDVRQSHLDINVMNSVKRNAIATKNAETAKRHRIEFNYLKLCFNADQVIAKNGNTDVLTWKSKAQIQAYLKPLRNTKDSKMPEDRDALIKRYNSWKYRGRKDLTQDEDVLAMFENWKRIELEKTRGKQSKNN